MFSRYRITKRASWLWPVLLVALVAGALAFAACGGEDPTATPEPDRHSRPDRHPGTHRHSGAHGYPGPDRSSRVLNDVSH